jgi:hypothetical protein
MTDYRVEMSFHDDLILSIQPVITMLPLICTAGTII